MKRNLLFVFLLVNTLAIYSQIVEPHVICSTNELYIVPKSEMRKLKSTQSIYHIPVVFHVFDPDDPESCFTLEDARFAIDLLNNNFSGKHRNINDVQSSFKSLVAECNYRFHLAKKDKYGNAFDGITYHKKDWKGDNPGANNTLKQYANFNTSGTQRYLQIWLTYNVNGDDMGSGWSYLPGTDYGGKRAGIVYNYKFINHSNQANNDILTHEVGHYLGLSHTFGSSYTQCGDDGIDDTPETRCYSWQCKKGNLCNDGLVNTENFMGYSGCTSMFTNGQKELMTYWLEHEYRRSLWSEENLIFTGIYKEISVGFEDKSANGVKIYPNPSNGTIYIDGLQHYRTELYNLSGRKVSESVNREISYTKPGLYFIRVYTDNQVFVEKILVE